MAFHPPIQLLHAPMLFTPVSHPWALPFHASPGFYELHFFLNWGFRDTYILIATIAVFSLLHFHDSFLLLIHKSWPWVLQRLFVSLLEFLVLFIFPSYLESFCWLLLAKLSWKLSNMVTLHFLYSIFLSDFPIYCLTKMIYFNFLTVFQIAAWMISFTEPCSSTWAMTAC